MPKPKPTPEVKVSLTELAIEMKDLQNRASVTTCLCLEAMLTQQGEFRAAAMVAMFKNGLLAL